MMSAEMLMSDEEIESKTQPWLSIIRMNYFSPFKSCQSQPMCHLVRIGSCAKLLGVMREVSGEIPREFAKKFIFSTKAIFIRETFLKENPCGLLYFRRRAKKY
jgi:hypothetical protein